jgi:quinoprotein glucose dehydrogenase
MNAKLRSLWAGAALAAVTVAAGPSLAESARSDWSYFGGSKRFDRYSPLSQINKTNVSRLQTVWTRPGLDASLKEAFPDVSPSPYLRGTPIIVDGTLYAPNAVGLVEAFDAATGATRWVQKPFANTLAEAAGQSIRTVDYWKSGREERIIAVRGEWLYALDPRDGSLITSFGQGGRASLNRDTPDQAKFFGFNGPLIVGDVIVIGGAGGGKAGGGYADGGNTVESTPEHIRGYDVRSGKLLWTTFVMPQKGEPGYESWGQSRDITGNMAAWAPLAADEQLGIVYVPLSAPTNSHYGGHRPGDNLYSDSILAIDARTGKLLWHHQLTHHDLWDYDIGSPPTVADLKVDGRTIKAVIQPNKVGFLFAFDRVTGKPIWPIHERPAPQSTVPGEKTSPTQPVPSRPPPFDVQGVTDDDLIDYSPELKAAARKFVAENYTGMGPLWSPPTLAVPGKRGVLTAPGGWGAGNWNTGAFDPETGRYYAVSMTMPGAFTVQKLDEPGTMPYGSPTRPAGGGGGAPASGPANYGPGPNGLPLLKGPYGRVTAFDMNKGEKLWTIANGEGPRNLPGLKELNLPYLGTIGRPVALVTKSLLFLGEASNAVMGGAGVGGPVKFRAYDKQSGAIVAEIPIPAGTTGGPITYMAGGKQMIVVPTGNATTGPAWIAMAVK